MFAHTVILGNWAPGIGDPSFMGWFTVFSYYCTALLGYSDCALIGLEN